MSNPTKLLPFFDSVVGEKGVSTQISQSGITLAYKPCTDRPKAQFMGKLHMNVGPI